MKKLNLIFMALLMASMFMLSACSDDGSGSTGGIIIPDTGYKVASDGSWEIYNAKGLYAFYDNVTYDNRSLNVILTDNITLELNNDNSSNWQQISDYYGIFDGNNHTITNVVMYEELTNNLAFFNNVYGTVKNVKFDNISVHGNNYIAGVAYRLQNGGVIENVSTDNKSNIKGNSDAGGIVYVNQGTIINTHNSATITSTDEIAGGIARTNNSGAKIIASSNSGNVTGDSWTGGIVGSNHGDVVTCYNEGIVTSNGSVGGIAGNNDSDANVISSYNIGELNGDAGGIVRNNRSVVNASFALSNTETNNGVLAVYTNTGTTDNVSTVDNVSMMNTTDNLTILNNAIIAYEDFINYDYGYRFIDGVENAPQHNTVPIVLRGISVRANVTSIEPNGDNTQLIVETKPTNVEYPSLKFDSNDESIATVSDNGTVTSGSIEDNVTITVSTEDNAFSATIDIIVEKAGHNIKSDGSWEIFKANGLVAFREAVNNDNNSLNAVLTDNITLALNSDNTSNWVKFNDYYGIFDGDNHTITNIAMHETLKDGLAFFNDIYGTIKNVKFDNISVDGNNSIAGVAIELQSGGLIENVSTDNKSIINGNDDASGIVYWNEGTIIYSHNSATVTSTGGGAGGIASYNSNNGKIIASYNSGNVTGDSWTGGVVGYIFSGDIIACYNEGSVTANGAGGIAGNNQANGNIISTYNIGQLNGSASGIAVRNVGTIKASFSLSNATINDGIDVIADNDTEGITDNVSTVGNISDLNDNTVDTGALWLLNEYIPDNVSFEFIDGGDADTAPKLRRKP